MARPNVDIVLPDQVAQVRAERLQSAREMLKKRVEDHLRTHRADLVQRRANRIAFQLRRAMA